MALVSDPRSLLGSPPTAKPLLDYVNQLSELTTAKQLPTPEIKAYPDALYRNYYSLGVSLMFVAKDGSKSVKDCDAESEKLALDSIDIYNPDPEKSKGDQLQATGGRSMNRQAREYAPYPAPNLVLPLVPVTINNKPRPEEIILSYSSTGKDILLALGEPDQKGGGAGPSPGSICIWCEWSKDGIMVEFGGPDARGPHAWEKGRDAKWRVLTLFRPKAS